MSGLATTEEVQCRNWKCAMQKLEMRHAETENA